MIKDQKYQLIVLLGPTAVGKTKVAVQLADRMNGEIISADSRQVYRGMNLGTGKDLGEYQVAGKQITYHLIDNIEAGQVYDVFSFQRDFYKALDHIEQQGRLPILCGGTGLYLEAALSARQLLEVKKNHALRDELKDESQSALIKLLKSINPELHNTTDLEDRDRLIRAIEIATKKKNTDPLPSPLKNYRIYGLTLERSELRERIKKRLDERLQQGMIEEVEALLKAGIGHERLDYYGLEYRYIAMYLRRELTYQEMYVQLLQAIRRFAKKQMTWYRRMERKGEMIKWFNAEMGSEAISQKIISDIRSGAI